MNHPDGIWLGDGSGVRYKMAIFYGNDRIRSLDSEEINAAVSNHMRVISRQQRERGRKRRTWAINHTPTTRHHHRVESRHLRDTSSIPISFTPRILHSQSNNMANNVSRLPTLSEVVSSKTRSPVDLFGFYVYMRDHQRAVDCKSPLSPFSPISLYLSHISPISLPPLVPLSLPCP